MLAVKRPKSALWAARIALLAGASAAALSLLVDTAYADNISYDSHSGTGSCAGLYGTFDPGSDGQTAQGPCATNGTTSPSTPVQATTAGNNATALGAGAYAGAGITLSGNNTTAVGTGAAAIGQGASAFGDNSSAVGNGSIAIGSQQFGGANGTNAIAIGTNAFVAGDNSIGLGAGANVGGFTNSVAIGANATVTSNNQIVLGAAGTTTQVQALNVATLGHGVAYIDTSGNLQSTTALTTGTTGVTSISVTGAIQGGSLTDGTATLQNGNLTGVGNISGTGTISGFSSIQGTAITDGTASLTGGALSGVTGITGNGTANLTGFNNVTTNSLTTGSAQITSLGQGVVVSDPAGNLSSTTSLTGANALSGLTVTGTTNLQGQTNFGAGGSTFIDSSGNLTVGGTTTTNGITNTGNVTTDSLTVNSNATVGGTLGVTGNTTLGGDLGVTGNYTTTNGNITTTNGNITATNGTVSGNSVSAGSGGLSSTGGLSVSGGAVFTPSSANGNQITIDSSTGAFVQQGLGANSSRSITLNAAADQANFTGMVVTVNNPTSTSVTTITDGNITSTVTGGGSTTINGGTVTVSGTYTGDVTGLKTSNASTQVSGGAIVNNGLIANGGFIASGPAQGQPASYVDMGGNVVHDVGTPIVGTDAANKAYVDKGVNKAFEGTALALAISQPLFMPGQSFAIRAGWGDYEGQNAFGVSAAGVVAHNVLGYGSTVIVDAGIGVGGNYNGVAGKAGVTLGFGGAAPLK